MEVTEISPPRHDFYQTANEIILAVYQKGLSNEGVKDQVEVNLQSSSVSVTFPQSEQKQRFVFQPLFAEIDPQSSSSRILSSKIELKLSKSKPEQWPTFLSTSSTSTSDPSSGSSAMDQIVKASSDDQATGNPSQVSSTSADPSPETPQASGSTPIPGLENLPVVGENGANKGIGGPAKINAKTQKKNWDKIMASEKEDDDESKDPNAGGDSALQKMFSKIYAGADENTKKAMIKSFTESGGTALSTDWNTIGKEKTKIQPPDGMEARKYGA